MSEYAERDIVALDEAGGHYIRHISAMTGEGLHEKSEIAAELAYRDKRIIDMLTHVYGCQTQLAAAQLAKAALQAERDRLREKADKWDALFEVGRVRMVGCAGLSGDTLVKDEGYAHIGLEFWTKHTAESAGDTIEWVDKYIAKALKEVKP